MRTWVRRVRLWLGVLLLAVGVVGCTVGMFVHQEFCWQRYRQMDTGRIQGSHSVNDDWRGKWRVEVATRGGWISISGDFDASGKADTLSSLQTERAFSWQHRLVRPVWFNNAEKYAQDRIEGWKDWSIVGFGWRLRNYECQYSTGQVATFQSTRRNVEVTIPYYLLILLGLVLCYPPLRAAIVNRRLGGRRRRGECLACGYDRRSLGADVPCPECGAGGPEGQIATASQIGK